MKASQLDNDVTCPICGGSGDENTERVVWGECPLCEGGGTVNRVAKGGVFRDEYGEHPQVLIGEGFEDHGTHAAFVRRELPIEHPVVPSFNGLFGDYVASGLANAPSDVTPGQQVRSRLEDATDLTPQDAAAWAESVGVPEWAAVVQKLADEQPTL